MKKVAPALKAYAITAGSDGNLWFTSRDDNKIGRITPAGAVSYFTDPNVSYPLGITAGPDGNVWFTNFSNGTIGRITPSGVITTFPVNASSGVRQITVGTDGNLWFTVGATNTLGVVSAGWIGSISTAGIVGPAVTGLLVADPDGIAAGADGYLYFYNRGYPPPGWVGRVSTAGAVTNAKYTNPGMNHVESMISGPGGKVWFTDSGSGSIGSIGSGGSITMFTDPSIQLGVDVFQGIAAGPDGSVWFTNQGPAVSIGRITPAGVVTAFTGITGGTPYGIAGGPDGNMWFAVNSTSAGSIWRIGASRSNTPLSVTATAGNAQATVAWTAPTYDGGSPITGYTVTASPGGATCSWTTGPLSCVVTGLTNGTPYTFTVTAANVNGTSTPSVPSAAVIPATVPGAPTGVNAHPGDGIISVLWDAPASNGGAPITKYTATASPGGATCTATPADPIPQRCFLTPVTNGVAYTVTVTATNNAGTGPASAPSAPVVPATVPGAPTNVTGVGGNAQVVVSWEAPASDGFRPITSYTITATPSGKTCTWSSGPLTCTVSGLTNATTYTFIVTASNAFGAGQPSAPSPPVATVTTGLPSAPTDVHASAGAGQVGANWSPPVDRGSSSITSYTVTVSPGGRTCTVVPGGVLGCVVTGLSPGTSYTVTVAATNAAGTGPPSAPTAPVVTPTVPAAPTNAVTTAGQTSLRASWSAPTTDGGSAITGYTVTVSPGGATCTWTTGPLTCVVTGLASYTSYTFTVTATNAVGTGPASASSAPVVLLSVPSAPINVVATAGTGQLTASWSAPAFDGGSPITRYVVGAFPGGGACTWTTGPLTCVVTGLTNGTYTLTVTAVSARGSSPASASNPAVVVTVPASPMNATATAGNGQLTASWSAPPSDGGLSVTRYTVTVSPGGGTCTWTSGPLACVVTGLTNGTSSTFTVTATNAVGTGPASATSDPVVPATIPGAPTSATATAGNGQLTANWSAPASNGGRPITGYTVTVSPGGGTCTWTTGPLTCVVTGLTNGTSYTFTVTATNPVGTGLASTASNPVVSATTPAAPTNAVAAAGKGQLTATWSAPASDGGLPITGYTVTVSPGGGTCTWTTGPLTCVVTGLSVGTAYTFTVTATNGVGLSAPSTASNGVVPWDGAGYHPINPVRVLDSRTNLGSWKSPLVAGAPRDLPVSIGSAATTAVVMNVTVTGGTSGSFVTAYPAGTATPVASNLNFGSGQTIANLVTVKLGPGRTVSFANAVGSVDVIADVVGYYDDGTIPGDLFNGINPTRLLDSRTNNGGWNASLTAGAPRDLFVRQPANPNGVPATATAVIANITVTGGTNGSFLSAWPSSAASQPQVSNLNFGAGQTIPNLAIIKIGTDGNIRFANAVGSVDVIVDVVGYFDPTSGSRFHAINPTRILDSRVPTGLAGPWGPNQTRSLAVAGAAGTNVPAAATGLVTNVTATGGTAGSFISVYPDGVAVPTSSNVNFGAGETIPNLVTVKIPASGKIAFYNKLGDVDIIADAVGYYAVT